MQGLTEGRIVHFVLPDGRSKGQHRPAIVVKVWSDECVNLTVFTDHANDYDNTENPNGELGVMWATSVNFDENKSEGTWHWIEQA